MLDSDFRGFASEKDVPVHPYQNEKGTSSRLRLRRVDVFSPTLNTRMESAGTQAASTAISNLLSLSNFIYHCTPLTSRQLPNRRCATGASWLAWVFLRFVMLHTKSQRRTSRHDNGVGVAGDDFCRFRGGWPARDGVGRFRLFVHRG